MTWWKKIEAIRSKLEDGGQVAVIAAMLSARNRFGSAATEPQIVEELVTSGTRVLAQNWVPLFAMLGVRCNIWSSFVHGRPLVKAASRNSCELGDVLYLHVHKTYDRRTFLRALLLQAKMTNGKGCAPVSPGDDQFYLYSRWPAFQYVRSGSKLNGAQRTVRPDQPHLGAQYLLIDDFEKALDEFRTTETLEPLMFVAPAEIPIAKSSNRSLASALVNLLLGRDGRVVGRYNKSLEGWTRVMYDLLHYSATHVFARSSAHAGSAKQTSMIAMYSELKLGGTADFDIPYLLSKVGEDFAPPPGQESLFDGSLEIPMVIIQTADERSG